MERRAEEAHLGVGRGKRIRAAEDLDDGGGRSDVKDLSEVDEAVKQAVTFIPCETVADALALALNAPLSIPTVEKSEIPTPRIIPDAVKPTVSEQAGF